MRTFLIASSLVFLSFTATVGAAVPETMSYQGVLTDSTGAAVADGGYNVVFNIYDADIGGGVKWSSGVVAISTTGGLFTYELGSGTPLSSDIFADNTNLWLGIRVGADPEISPRTKLSSHGWSFHSASTDSLIAGPGVKQKIVDNSGFVAMVNGFTVLIDEDTLFAPDSGYVLIQATANVQCLYLPTAEAGFNLELRDSTLTHLTDQEFFWILTPGLPAGSGYAISMHIHRIFKVRPGRNIFFLAGQDFFDPGHTFLVVNRVITMTYFQYNYGDIQLLPAPAVTGDKPRAIPISSDELQGLRDRSGFSLGSNK